MSIATQATTRELFDALHRPGEHIAVCHHDAGHFRATVTPAGDAAILQAGQHMHTDVWHSVNPVRPNVSGRGTAQDVTRLAALWADLDIGEGVMPTMQAARAVIADLSEMLNDRPVFIVATGHGLHPYWILEDDEHLTLTTPEKRAAATALLARWRRLVTRVAVAHGGAVDNVYDLARVLRTPGTQNHKDAHAGTGPALPVTLEADTGHALDVTEVLETFTAYGVPELDTDTGQPATVHAPAHEWPEAASTCPYVARMVGAWATDTPTGGRHYWAYSQHIRAACALRLGCITQADYARALARLQTRLDELRAHSGHRPGEVTANDTDARAAAERKTHAQARAELGDHTHHTAGEDARGGLAGLIPDLPPEQAPDWQETPQDTGTGPGTTWQPLDLTATVAGLLAGTIKRHAPTIAARDDGACLFYAGKVNGVAGASGSGKTWTALHAAAQQIAAGHHAVYVDLEDDEVGVVGRMLDLGADPDLLAGPGARFHYLHPEEAFTDASAEHLAATIRKYRPTLVVIDSTGESMAIDGAKPNDDDDTARWFRRLPTSIANTGPAVVVLDHVVKADDGGLWPIGSQRKRAAINGAQYMQTTVRPFSKGHPGAAKLICAKDRHGNYRPGQRVTDLAVNPAGAGVHIIMRTPSDAATPTAETFRPTALMEKASRALEATAEPLSTRKAYATVRGKQEYVRAALDVLVAEGFANRHDGPNRSTLYSSNRPYRQADDPQSDAYTGVTVGVSPSLEGEGGDTHPTTLRTHPGHTRDTPPEPQHSNGSAGTHPGTHLLDPAAGVSPVCPDCAEPLTGPGHTARCRPNHEEK
ncbi:AAA family ATPase [Pseudactinotalea sp. Z1739]|uniref:AAA family ATPase n=1 Tax=Pseudactinotalea sp. Z1739 TaxID=3413028 RepID=UPI003C7A223D